MRRLLRSEPSKYIATVPQAVALPPAFTVWETVLFGRTPYLGFLGQPSKKDEEIAQIGTVEIYCDGSTSSCVTSRIHGLGNCFIWAHAVSGLFRSAFKER